jgi:hypothetical protein
MLQTNMQDYDIMNPTLHIEIDVPDLVQSKIEAAQLEIENATGFHASMNELYVFALANGADNIAPDYIDAVIIAAERIKQRELPLSELANLSK